MAKKEKASAEEPQGVSNISLSQAILAPLLSIFKAQVHSARSFLSFLFQIGTPHLELNPDGSIKDIPENKENLYTQNFKFKKITEQGKEETIEIKIPTLSLVPIAPLGIDTAEFEFDFNIENYHEHRQMQKSEEPALNKEKPSGFDENFRPWYLIDKPINFDGNVAPPKDIKDSSLVQNTMKIKIKVSRQPIPSGLDKLLVSFNQMITVSQTNDANEPK
jgi:hypothetical protein